MKRIRRGTHGLLCGPGLFLIMRLEPGATRGTLALGPFGYRQEMFSIAIMLRQKGQRVWIEANGLTAQRQRRIP